MHLLYAISPTVVLWIPNFKKGKFNSLCIHRRGKTSLRYLCCNSICSWVEMLDWFHIPQLIIGYVLNNGSFHVPLWNICIKNWKHVVLTKGTRKPSWTAWQMHLWLLHDKRCNIPASRTIFALQWPHSRSSCWRPNLERKRIIILHYKRDNLLKCHRFESIFQKWSSWIFGS